MVSIEARDNGGKKMEGGRERERERKRSRKGEVMGFHEIRSPPPLIMDKTIINSTRKGKLFGLLGNIN